jgi:hypothetical protein
MFNDKNLIFLKEKIEDLSIALFHCDSKSLLRIPTTIIKTHSVDANGEILFFINRPQQSINEFDQEFLVALNYFKKGKNYFMNISGKARMVKDPEELTYITNLTPAEVTGALTNQVLIKVKILKVDFYDNHIATKNHLLKKTQTLVYGLFDWGVPGAKSYDFSSASALPPYGILSKLGF